MRFSRERVLAIVCAVLAVTLVVFVMYGCKCTRENFAAAPTAAAPTKATASALTGKEQELFDDLVNNKVDDSAIQKLIKDGFLTEKMVERFLANLPAAPAPAAEKPVKLPVALAVPKPDAPKAAVATAAKATPSVEAFESGGYALF